MLTQVHCRIFSPSKTFWKNNFQWFFYYTYRLEEEKKSVWLKMVCFHMLFRMIVTWIWLMWFALQGIWIRANYIFFLASSTDSPIARAIILLFQISSLHGCRIPNIIRNRRSCKKKTFRERLCWALLCSILTKCCIGIVEIIIHNHVV